MKRCTLVFVAAIAISGCSTFSPNSESAIRNALRRETLVHHLRSPGFGGFFSVVDGIDWKKREFVELPPGDLLYVLQRCPMELKATLFVPVQYLRLPKEDERDPTSESGRWRGTEDTRTGFRVYVLYISKIEKRRDGTYEVHYENFNGPLAGGGGSYIATRTADGWTFQRSNDSWAS